MTRRSYRVEIAETQRPIICEDDPDEAVRVARRRARVHGLAFRVVYQDGPNRTVLFDTRDIERADGKS